MKEQYSEQDLIIHGNCFTQAFFRFMIPTYKLANRRVFQKTDFKLLPHKLTYHGNYSRYQDSYQQNRNKNSLIVIILKWIFPVYVWSFVCSLWSDGVYFVLPIVLKKIIDWIEILLNDSEPDKSNPIF